MVKLGTIGVIVVTVGLGVFCYVKCYTSMFEKKAAQAAQADAADAADAATVDAIIAAIIQERKDAAMPDSVKEIGWPIAPAWSDVYGSGPQSQRDYNLWLLGRIATNQKDLNRRFVAAFNAIDPNFMKVEEAK